jgi:hypothetical protein
MILVQCACNIISSRNNINVEGLARARLQTTHLTL